MLSVFSYWDRNRAMGKFERNPSDCCAVSNRDGFILGSLYPPSACKEQHHSCLQEKKAAEFSFPQTNLFC